MSFNFCLKTPKIDDARSKRRKKKNFRDLREKRKKREQSRERKRPKKIKKSKKNKTKNISLSLSHLSADLIALFFLPRVCLITQRA